MGMARLMFAFSPAVLKMSRCARCLFFLDILLRILGAPPNKKVMKKSLRNITDVMMTGNEMCQLGQSLANLSRFFCCFSRICSKKRNLSSVWMVTNCILPTALFLSQILECRKLGLSQQTMRTICSFQMTFPPFNWFAKQSRGCSTLELGELPSIREECDIFHPFSTLLFEKITKLVPSKVSPNSKNAVCLPLSPRVVSFPQTYRWASRVLQLADTVPRK